MAATTTPGTPRQPIPLQVLRSDLANGCVPPTYLQSLIRPGTKHSEATAHDLRDCPNPKDLERIRGSVLGAKISLTHLIEDRTRFIGLATECLMCNIGSVAVVDPGQIAQSYISANAKGTSNEFVNEFLSSVDLIFLDAVAAPVVTGYLQNNPEAAHHFFSFMKTTRYAAGQHLVIDMSAHYRLPTKGRPQIADAIAQVYGYDTANLLLADALTL